MLRERKKREHPVFAVITCCLPAYNTVVALTGGLEQSNDNINGHVRQMSLEEVT